MSIIFEFLVLGAVGAAFVGGFFYLKRRMPHSAAYRRGAALAIAAAFLLFWVNGAIGIIGSENNDANALYLAVPTIAFVGALSARFRPAGMTRAMVAAAVAQVLVPVIAVAARIDATRAEWQADVAGATLFFCVLWLASARSFRQAEMG